MRPARKVSSVFLQITCILLLVALVTCVNPSDDDVRRLLNHTLNNYNKNIRPVKNQLMPTIIYFDFWLLSLMEFDEVRGELAITAMTGLRWKDEFLNWQMSDYNYLTNIVLQVEDIWVPSLVLFNTLDEIDVVGQKPWQQLRVTNDGTVVYYPTELFKAYCSADVTYYPFDRHVCSFTFSVWTYFPSEIVFNLLHEEVLLMYYQKSGAWALEDTAIRVIRNETQYINFVTVFLLLKREPRFILVNLVVPIVCLGFVNLVIFFIPADSGEKISYSITMLLSVAVFMTLVGDNMPKTSTPMSYFSYYLLGVLIMSVLIIFVTVFNLRIFHTDETEPVTGCWLQLAKLWRCGCCKARRRKRTKLQGKTLSYMTFKGNASETFTIPVRAYAPQASQDIAYHTKAKSKNRKECDGTCIYTEVDRQVTWKNVSDAMDKTAFVLFGLSLIAGTVTFFVTILNKDETSLLDDTIQTTLSNWDSL